MKHVLKVKSIKLHLSGPFAWVSVSIGSKKELQAVKDGIAEWDSVEKDHIHIQPKNLRPNTGDIEIYIEDEMAHKKTTGKTMLKTEIESVIDLPWLVKLVEAEKEKEREKKRTRKKGQDAQ